jgi:hypothetical protein
MYIESVRLTPEVAPIHVRRAETARLREARTRYAREWCREIRARIMASRRRIARGEDLLFGSACCLADTLDVCRDDGAKPAPQPVVLRRLNG